MGIFERFGIMRSILTVECVGWFGTKEYLSVIFRNIGWLIQNRVNHLKTRAHYSIHHNLATDEVFAADKKTHRLLQPEFHSTEWFISGDDQQVTTGEPQVPRYSGTQVPRYSGTQVPRWASGAQLVSRSGDGVWDLWQLGRLVAAVQGWRLVVRHRSAHLP